MVEKMLVVFGIGGVVPVFVCGKYLEKEAVEDPEFLCSKLDDYAHESGKDPGMKVFEGSPVTSSGHIVNFDSVEWRDLTVHELGCFIRGENPWK